MENRRWRAGSHFNPRALEKQTLAVAPFLQNSPACWPENFHIYASPFLEEDDQPLGEIISRARPERCLICVHYFAARMM